MPRMSVPDKTGLRVGQYLRVSVDRHGNKRSTDEQGADNDRDIAEQGWHTTRVYEDVDRSASRYATKVRDDFAAVLRDIPLDVWDVLDLWESSRGSRKVSEWVVLLELLEKHRKLVRVTTHHRTYDPRNHRDRRTLLEDAVDSEYESGKTSDRILRTVAASAVEGRPHGMIAYGYAREYDVTSGKARYRRQIPDPVTAPVVREIVARILRGDPLRAIADDLTRRGIPTPLQHRARRLGKPVPEAAWSRATIRTLMGSPTMAGSRVHQGQVIGEGKWEPLVSAADFALVQLRMQTRTLQANPGSGVRHLLSGVAECGVCGAKLRREMNNGVPSYVCAGKPPQQGQPRPSRKHVTRAQEGLDAMVTRYVVGHLADPGLIEAMAMRQARDVEEVAIAAGELADLRARLAQLEESVAAGGITPAAFGRIEARMLEQIAAVQARLSGSGGLPAAVLELAGPQAEAKWAELEGNVAVQRLVVRAMVRVVVHRSTVRGRHRFDTSTIEISDL